MNEALDPVGNKTSSISLYGANRRSLRFFPNSPSDAHAQTLIDIFYWPLVRWFEQQRDAARGAETVCCPVSRADIAAVFSNVDELISFSRHDALVCLIRRSPAFHLSLIHI